MSLNSQSATNPTGQTQTQNNFYNPAARSIQQSAYQNDLDATAVYGGHFPGAPFRPGQYAQNWSGVTYWQTWDVIGGLLNGAGYPTNYREYVSRGGANDTVQLLLSRNQPQQYAPAPIAISQYALATQQVYVGSDYSG
jgi:hypothetical protein